MKKILIISLLLLQQQFCKAQDVSILVVAQQANINDGDWEIGATNTVAMLTICNDAGDATILQPYRVRPLVTVPNAIMTINAVQPNIPAGWTILSNDGTSIRLSNGTATIASGDCVDIPIEVTPTAANNPAGIAQNIDAVMEFANGTAPGNVSGAATAGNMTFNDNSSSAVIVTGTPLPISLKSFSGYLKDKHIGHLDWTVANPKNVEGYIVERNTEGGSFSEVAFVKATEQSSYSFDDDLRQQSGNIFYRLKVMYSNDASEYSTVVKIVLSKEGNIVLFPNPANKRLNIRSRNISNVVVTDMLGQRKEIPVVNIGSDLYELNTALLGNGMYNITIYSDQRTFSQRIVVVH